MTSRAPYSRSAPWGRKTVSRCFLAHAAASRAPRAGQVEALVGSGPAFWGARSLNPPTLLHGRGRRGALSPPARRFVTSGGPVKEARRRWEETLGPSLCTRDADMRPRLFRRRRPPTRQGRTPHTRRLRIPTASACSTSFTLGDSFICFSAGSQGWCHSVETTAEGPRGRGEPLAP